MIEGVGTLGTAAIFTFVCTLGFVQGLVGGIERRRPREELRPD